jgi:hypothetical protein
MAIVLSHQEGFQRVGPVTTPVDEPSISEAKRTRYHHLCKCYKVTMVQALGTYLVFETLSFHSSILARQFYPMPRGMWKAIGNTMLQVAI